MNKVTMTIKKLEYGKSEVTFTCAGDIWKWVNKKAKKNETLASSILEDVRYNEVHEFTYDIHLDKFVKRFKDVVDQIEII